MALSVPLSFSFLMPILSPKSHEEDHLPCQTGHEAQGLSELPGLETVFRGLIGLQYQSRSPFPELWAGLCFRTECTCGFPAAP